MATSGTINKTRVDVTSMIERAIRRCGVLTSLITSEMQANARECLFLILSGLANRGISLWCVEKHITQMTTARAVYPLPVGTVDVLEVLLRYGSNVQATSIGVNLVSLVLAESSQITTASVTVTNAGDYALVFETSPDNVSWTVCGSITQTDVPAGEVLCMDADPSPTNIYWRVRDTANAAAAFTAGVFMFGSYEITMAKLSRDDYVNLPNKAFQSLNPLQFWYDKQINPSVAVWPIPQDDSRQMVLWLQRHIQDPGAYTNTLDVPQRWLNAVNYMLAEQVYLELPTALVDPARYPILVKFKDQYLQEAENGEQDGAPVRWAPDLAPYTR